MRQSAIACAGPEIERSLDKLVELVEWPLRRGIACRAVWIGMRLEEEAVGAGDRRGGQKLRNELAGSRARAFRALARLLNRVSGVEDDGRPRSRPETGKVAHVHDEVAVPEEGSALGHCKVSAPPASDLFNGTGHRLGVDPLALLHVDRLSRASGGDEQVSLTAEKGGDLKDVGDRGRRAGVAGLVNVGEYRQPARGSDPFEDPKSFVETRSPRRVESGTIRLVEARLEADWNPTLEGDSGESIGHSGQHVAGLDDAGARDEKRSRPERPGHQ